MYTTTYSYSQNPKVDTRFQFITPPQADKIFLIIPSGTFSLRLPTTNCKIMKLNIQLMKNHDKVPIKTVILGPSSSNTGMVGG